MLAENTLNQDSRFRRFEPLTSGYIKNAPRSLPVPTTLCPGGTNYITLPKRKLNISFFKIFYNQRHLRRHLTYHKRKHLLMTCVKYHPTPYNPLIFCFPLFPQKNPSSFSSNLSSTQTNQAKTTHQNNPTLLFFS